jgi:hypothetical protein
MLAVRGMAAGLLFLALIWLVTDFMLHAAYRRYKKSNVTKDMEAVAEQFNVNLFVHLWCRFTPPPTSRTVSVNTPRALTSPSGREGMVSRLVSTGSTIR